MAISIAEIPPKMRMRFFLFLSTEVSFPVEDVVPQFAQNAASKGATTPQLLHVLGESDIFTPWFI